MAKIANVALTNTFDYWRQRSNESFDRLSQFAVNNSKLYANTLIGNNVLKSLGNTVLGAAGKRTVVNGLLSANGRVTIGTNLDTTGNTSTNKITVTTSLRSTGNNVLGAATKKTVIEGYLSANGRATVATNLDVTGNTSANKITVTSRLTSSGNTSIVGLLANNSLGTAGYVLKTNGTAVYWDAAGGGGQTNVFSAIAVSGQNTLYADGPNDTLTLAAGYAISITTNNTTDTATIRATNILASNAYANATFAGKQSPATSGLHAHTGRSTISQNLRVSGNSVFGGSGKKTVVNGDFVANVQTASPTGIQLGTAETHGTTVAGRLGALNIIATGNNSFGGASKVQTSQGAWTHTGTFSVTTNFTATNSNTQVLALGVGCAPSTNGSIRATNDITAYYSDERLKINLGVIQGALGKVDSLSGFYFRPNHIARGFGYEDREDVGVSAQQVQNILPQAVVPAPVDDKYLTVKYEKLIPLLIEAIKELKREVEELKRNR